MPKRKHEDWEARLGSTSFDPLEALDLEDAIRARQDTVVLSGRSFTLRYEGMRVKYTPVEGFVPTGWIDITRIEKGV